MNGQTPCKVVTIHTAIPGGWNSAGAQNTERKAEFPGGKGQAFHPKSVLKKMPKALPEPSHFLTFAATNNRM